MPDSVLDAEDVVVRKTKAVNKRLFLELTCYAGDQQSTSGHFYRDVISGSTEP